MNESVVITEDAREVVRDVCSAMTATVPDAPLLAWRRH